jgi:fructose-bisphosphate aldolase class 1
MQNLSNGEFSPEAIEIMTAALEAAVATLPDPVHASHVNALAESILRTASTGERDVANLQRIALMELQLASRG